VDCRLVLSTRVGTALVDADVGRRSVRSQRIVDQLVGAQSRLLERGRQGPVWVQRRAGADEVRVDSERRRHRERRCRRDSSNDEKHPSHSSNLLEIFPPKLGGSPFRQVTGSSAPPVDSGARHHLPSSAVLAGVRGMRSVQPPRSTCNRGAGLFSIRFGQAPALIRSFVLGNETEPQYLSRSIVPPLAPALSMGGRPQRRWKEEEKGRKMRVFPLLSAALAQGNAWGGIHPRAGRLARPPERPLSEAPGFFDGSAKAPATPPRERTLSVGMCIPQGSRLRLTGST